MGASKERSAPPLFAGAVEAIMAMRWRPEIVVEEIPAPQKIAPFAVAVGADVLRQDAELASGRLVLLHDPAGNLSWNGNFRCVTYARADVDPDMVADPLLTDVGWSWLLEALERNRADYVAPSGTVTAVSSKAFGAISTEPPRTSIELRASWTPNLTGPDQIAGHLAAWSDLLCMTAGLPPLPDGVVPIHPRRPGARSR